MANQRKGKEFISAASCDSTTTEKTSFGIPSPIPFMGRQKFFESRTYHSGETYLEVFDKEKPLKPIVQFKRNFQNLTAPPVFGTTAAWVQGAEKPLLVFVDKEKPENGKIFLVSCPFQN